MPKTDLPKILLDTSVPNFALAGRDEKAIATKKLFKLINKGEFDVYISDVLIEEIGKTPDANHRRKLAKVLDSFNSTLLLKTEAAEKLAREYLARKIIPKKFRNDALHIAIAAVNFIPTVVTWNLKHMASLRTMEMVNKVNATFGYPQLRILTPYELVGHLLDESDF